MSAEPELKEAALVLLAERPEAIRFELDQLAAEDPEAAARAEAFLNALRAVRDGDDHAADLWLAV